MKYPLSTCVTIAAVGIASQTFAQENNAAPAALTPAAEPVAKPVSVVTAGEVTPESAVLPAQVARFRAIYKYAYGSEGFNSEGKKIKIGADVVGSGSALVAEYGLTDNLSAQVLVPFSYTSSTKTNSDFDAIFDAKFKTATTFSPSALPPALGAQIVAGVASQLTASGACPSAAACTVLINAGTIKASTIGGLNFATLAAGNSTLKALTAVIGTPASIEGTNTIKATDIAAKFTSQIATYKALQKKAAEDKKRETGLGDIELGLKYAFSSVASPLLSEVPLYASIAAGVRLNSSGYLADVKAGKIPRGRGTTDGALRLDVDYKLIQGFIFTYENQTEAQLLKGKTYTNKEVNYERVGMRNIGFARLTMAPGAFAPVLDVLNVTARFAYDYDAKVKINGVKSEYAPYQHDMGYEAILNGFVYKIPLQFVVDYTMPLSGKNVAVATSSVTTTLKAFYKF